jgi:hypothetical protein
MTNKRHIEIARQHLASGNKEAYIKLMVAGIRAAMSERTVNDFKQAMKQDGMFNLNTLTQTWGVK